jgi:hypothetical protein
MNIFILDQDPVKAAEYLCDKHVIKMLLESTQMLCTVHRLGGSTDNSLYKAAHIKHPCVIWLCESSGNYNWLVKHLVAMHEQYKLRYHREHKSFTELYHIVKEPPSWLKDIGLTRFALAVPELYKKEDPVLSYRLYYVCSKIEICNWKYPATEPYWFKEILNNISFYL